MERKITEKLRKWRSDPDRKPLIVTGCRQIGKTYSVKAFAESEYRSSIYINLETDPDKKELFEGSLEPDFPPAPSVDEMNEMFRRFKEAGGE